MAIDFKKYITSCKTEYNLAITNNETESTVRLLKSTLDKAEQLQYNNQNGIRLEAVQKTLKELSDLDYTTFPYDKAQELIKQLGIIPSMAKLVEPGQGVIRSRKYEKGQKSFTDISELSFKPSKYNTTYQRASTPFRTMFYSCPANSNIGISKVDSRITGVVESLPWIQDKTTCRMQRVSFGRWEAQLGESLSAGLSALKDSAAHSRSAL